MTTSIYYDASYGGIDLLIARIQTDGGRDIAVQSPSRGDKHVLQDRGKRLSAATCEVLFVNQPGLPDFLTRFDNFRQLIDAGGANVFSHPLIGSYLARASEFSHEAAEGAGKVTCSVKFLAENEPTVIVQNGAGVSTIAGLEAVTAAQYAASTALAASGFPSVPYLTDALNAATDWAAGDSTLLDSNTVFAQLASLSGELNQTINQLDLLSNLSNYQAYRALIGLGYQVQRAADAATSTADNVFDLTVAIPRPLIAICADVYGASAAVDRANDALSINRIERPGLVPIGTYKFPSDGARP